MRCSRPDPIRRRAFALPIGLISLFGLAFSTGSGCSSQSGGPETDVVEVERIEIPPTESTAPPAVSSPPVATEPGKVIAPPEEVPAAPAAK